MSVDTDPLETATLPLPAGEYTLDVAHSGVFFQVRHLGISNVRGTFKTFDAGLTVGDDLDSVAVTATIDMASVDTNQPDRDAHLLGTDFFHADEHPQMTFRSTGLQSVGGEELELEGELTINGITKPITLEVEFNGSEVFPVDQSVHVGFTASAEVRRSAYGIDFGVPLGMSKVGVGDKVKVDLDLQFIAP
jgi:polyisoprenoid-binding protein YceI